MHPEDMAKLEMVKQVGFCFHPVRSHEHGTDYIYTAGLHRNFKHPEIFVMGYAARDAANLIGLVYARIKNGDRFADAMIVDDIWKDELHAFRPMLQSSVNENGGRGQWLLDDEFPAVQLFFTDEDNRFPWDENCDPRCKRLQTSLLQVTPEIPILQARSLKLN